MATFYLDFEGGNDSNDGTTFANRWKTITSGATAARTAPGDVIRIMKSPDPVSLGVNGTFTKQSHTITLASAVTANISLCQAAWTASANVTTTTSATRKEGTLSTSIAPAAAFTTGLLAYEATGTLNLSAYQNVTFWIRTSSAVSANVLRLDLCSDTAGATPVHSITIDTAFAANVWKPVTWKNGSALSSSIQSVALTALSDPGTPTILIDNIIATNDLHFNSLIGTSSSATHRVWYPVKSINGTTVIIGHSQTQDASSTSRGWHDTTTTSTAYVRDCILITSTQTINESGNDPGNMITYSGGWDRTNMASQDGISFLVNDQNINITSLFVGGSNAFMKIERIATVWGNIAYNTSGTYNRYNDCGEYGALNYWRGSTGSVFSNFYHISCDSNFSLPVSSRAIGLYCYSCTSGLSMNSVDWGLINDCESRNNNGAGLIDFNGIITNFTSSDNATWGILNNNGKYLEINKLTTSGNGSGGVSALGIQKLNNVSISEATKFATTSALGRVYLSRYASKSGIISIQGTDRVYSDATVLHGSTTISWRHDTWTNDSLMPVVQPLQPFAVAASSLVTFKIWVYRTSTNVEGRVRLRGYVTPGVDADVTATITAAINTWQELTVTCTPSAAGVVQIDLESYSVNGSTGTVYFGDATVSQA